MTKYFEFLSLISCKRKNIFKNSSLVSHLLTEKYTFNTMEFYKSKQKYLSDQKIIVRIDEIIIIILYITVTKSMHKKAGDMGRPTIKLCS